MYFRFNRRFNVLKVEDSFAKLVGLLASGDMFFEFTYSISQLQAVQKNSLKVNVSVLSKTIPRRPLLQNSHVGYINTRSLVQNILTQVTHAKLVVKEQETYTVATRASDISAWINNEIVGQLRAGTNPEQIPSFTTTKLVTKPASTLKLDNEVKPLMQFLAHTNLPAENIDTLTSSSLDLDTRQTMFDMILRQGIDPSHITELTHRSIPASYTLGGIVRPTRAPEQVFDPSVQLLNYYVLNDQAEPSRTLTNQIQDDVLVQVVEQVTKDELDIPVRIVIPKHARFLEGADTSHFLVKFDLIDGKTKATIDSITKTLDVARHIQLYYTPRKPPVVQVSASEVSSRVNLEIKQVDSGATSVQVYKKTLYRATVEVEDYTLIGTYPLTAKQQSLIVAVEKPLNSNALYRIVPVGLLGTKGFEYTNVVVAPSRYFPIKAVAINAKCSELGIEVEIRQFPPSATSVEILAKNLTTHDSVYRNVGGVNLIDDASRVADYVSVTDTLVSEGRVYEYVARVTYKSGLSELSGNAIIEFVKLTPGKVDLQISDVDVTNEGDEPNVTFNIRSIVVDENIDVVLALLKRQDIKEFFDGDIAKEREFLKSLIAHNVQRVDLNSGRREDFGVVVDDFFDDRGLRKNNSVSPLAFGKKYRYEISTLLRAPETMFDQFVKTKVDGVTQKSYTFSPSKFLHPIVLTRGVIVTAAGLRTRYTKEAMSHGLIGSMETIEISFDDQPARIQNPASARFNRSLNIITWKLEGSIDQIDHFLITKDVHGVRTIIGKAHSEFEFGNCQYLHPVSSRDQGELKYIITPVFNSYRIGVSAITNSVVV